MFVVVFCLFVVVFFVLFCVCVCVCVFFFFFFFFFLFFVVVCLFVCLFLCVCSFPVWCLGKEVEFNCIGSLSALFCHQSCFDFYSGCLGKSSTESLIKTLKHTVIDHC